MSLSFTLRTVFRFWAHLDCPTSLKLKLLAEAGEWTEVLAVKVEPGNFVDPFEYAKANAAVTVLKKFPDLPVTSDDDRRRVALADWKAGEASCYSTNERLSPYVVSPFSGDAPAEFLRRVRRHLLGWLGRAPDDDELKTRARHGPGTTFSSTVASPTAADKYSEEMTVTPGAMIHILNLAGTKWSELALKNHLRNPGRWYSVVRGNRHAFVPKDALKFRNIAIEPSINIYFQLAVGSAIRARLRKRAGWDLDNASTYHREMARRASIDDSFVTLDLTNASDTVAKNLVRVLLHDTPWLEILEDLRSTHTCVEGRWHLLEKFSSMGNGYTFELESCVFAAIAAACLELKGQVPVLGHNLFVFGDDIIIPKGTEELVVAALEWCGLEINKKKSYTSGPFRESCGGDFFLGHPVRGYYLKEALTKANHQRTFSLHNGLKAVLERCSLSEGDLLMTVRNFLPEHLRHIGGSRRLGDTVLHGVPENFRWKGGVRWVRSVRWSTPILIKWKYFSEEARMACRLTGYGDTFGINTRGARVCQELTWVSDS